MPCSSLCSSRDSRPEGSSRPISRRRRWPSRRSSPRSSLRRPISRSVQRWLPLGRRPDRRGRPTAAGGSATAGISARPATSGAAHAVPLIAGIGAAVGLRLVIGGPERATSMPAGCAFALALFLLASGAGWRPGRPGLRAALLGTAGGAAVVALWMTAHPGIAIDLAPLNAAIALWTPIVAVIAIAEEVALRGALFNALRGWRGDGLALVVTTALFGLMHVPLY